MRWWAALGLLGAATVAHAAHLGVGPYVQDARPDGFTIVWESDGPAHGLVRAGGVEVATDGVHHVARLTGLQPSTRYRYEVLLDGAKVASAETATAPAKPRPFTFVVYGDTRDGDEDERVIVRAALAESPELAFHTGDLVRNGGDAEAWSRFFANEAPLLATTPFYLAVGNHELHRDGDGAQVGRWFVFPDHGQDRRYYAVSWSNARFFVLDGNDGFAEQTAWLASELQTAQRENVTHLFAVMHQPALSMGGHCGAAVEQAEWVALFERYQVRAVFAGHDHCYQRLERNGVRYFVTGGGGAMVYGERSSCPAYDQAARRTYVAEHHYLRVRVNGDEVEVAALRPDRALPPIEVTRYRAGDPVVAGLAPPLVDDRWIRNPAARDVMLTVHRRWPLVFVALGLLGYILVRRRRRRAIARGA